MRSPLRTLLALTAAFLVLGALGASAATPATGGLTNPKHFFWAPGQAPQGTIADSTSNDLIYHGGNIGSGAIGVETTPAVYLVYWGPDWATGFQTADTDGKLFSSKTLQNYVNGFFGNVGGSPWAGVQTQYCRGTLPGSTSCVGGTGFVTQPEAPAEGRLDRPDPGPG